MLFRNEKLANFKISLKNWQKVSDENKQLVRDNIEKGISVYYNNNTYTIKLGDLSFECFENDIGQNAFLTVKTNLLDAQKNVICSTIIQTFVNGIENTDENIIPILPMTKDYPITTDNINTPVTLQECSRLPNVIDYSAFNDISRSGRLVLPYNTDFLSDDLSVQSLTKLILESYSDNDIVIYKQLEQKNKFQKLESSEFNFSNGLIKDKDNNNFNSVIIVILSPKKIVISEDDDTVSIVETVDGNLTFWHDTGDIDTNIIALDCMSLVVLNKENLAKEDLSLINPSNFGNENSPTRKAFISDKKLFSQKFNGYNDYVIIGIKEILNSNCLTRYSLFNEIETEKDFFVTYSFDNDTQYPIIQNEIPNIKVYAYKNNLKDVVVYDTEIHKVVQSFYASSSEISSISCQITESQTEVCNISCQLVNSDEVIIYETQEVL